MPAMSQNSRFPCALHVTHAQPVDIAFVHLAPDG
jgi:hypothetical protein